MSAEPLLPSPGLPAAFAAALEHSQYWPEATMRAHQHQRLEVLLRHARAQVPFYADRLAAVFRPDDSIDFDRWSELPILTRADLVDSHAQMQAIDLPPGAGRRYTAKTSGSTGVPVTTVHNTLAGLAGRLAQQRAQRWYGIDRSRHCLQWAGDDPEVGRWPDGLDQGPWSYPWMPASAGRSFQLNRDTPAAQVLEFMRRKGVGYLRGRGKTVQALALAALAERQPIPLLGILGFATGITDDEREDCRAAFGCEIFSLYSSKEGHAMASQCTKTHAFHVNSEIAFLEIVDGQGEPCPVGEVGRVVVTPLYSFAQPLIRYDQGDLAAFGVPCECGRKLPVMERIAGRTMHLFEFPDGTRVAPIVPDAARRVLGALYLQLAQVAPTRIEVRYVPDPSAVSRDEPAAELMLRSRTHPQATITFVQVTDLVRLEGGKFMQCVREF